MFHVGTSSGTIISYNKTTDIDLDYTYFVFKEYCSGDCAANTVFSLYLADFSNPMFEPEFYTENNSLVYPFKLFY